ncbi:aldehyde ferredoxin oxidoreductase [Candidatus Micrarchaeota archaeon]|nr:aldehyde ferredoxin oxidoreductase [Candidatus Micrarchaeota archaeon]
MKIIRVSLDNCKIRHDSNSDSYAGLGGRGLTSLLIHQETPHTCDPLGKDNKLVFAPGILTGTNLVNSGRLSVGSKSPLTGGIKESNVGGTASLALKRAGIDALVIDGAYTDGKWSGLFISKTGQVRLQNVDRYSKLRTYELIDRILSDYGDKHSVLCIGPAGELQVRSASIQCSDMSNRPSRAAGRGGLGAVMGSKGLKCIVIERGGDSIVPIADAKTFNLAAKEFSKVIREYPLTSSAMAQLGTAMMVEPINKAGAFPCYNATKGYFERWNDISAEALVHLIDERGGKKEHAACSKCIIRCSNVILDKKGRFLTAGLEYETIWSTGAMCGISDLDTIANLDFLCDDIGLDSMNTGVAVGVAMDSGYRTFGDSQAAMELVEEVAKGSKMGRIIGDGPASVGEFFRRHRAPVCKKQSIAAYDPRALLGMAVSYATSPMGADHTAGWVVGSNLAEFGGHLDRFSSEGQIEASRVAQVESAAYDSTGLCLFSGSPREDHPEFQHLILAMLGAKAGKTFSNEQYLQLGRRILRAEKTFNINAGFTSSDDRLPGFFYDEPLPPHNRTVTIRDEELDMTLDHI